MNIKQKMIKAMRKARAETPVYRDTVDRETPAMLDAALAVLADPENWTDEMAAMVDFTDDLDSKIVRDLKPLSE